MLIWVALCIGLLAAGCVADKKAAASSKEVGVQFPVPKSPLTQVKNNTHSVTNAATVITPTNLTPRAVDPALLTVTNGGLIRTLTDPLAGRVALVNPALKIVVLDYGLNRLPASDQRLGVYRQGQKVGEVQVSGPAEDGVIAGILLSGEAQIGDEVRREP